MNALLLKAGVWMLKLAMDKVIMSIVTSVVKDVATELPNVANENKRAEALKRIKKELKKNGKDAQDHLLNLALELVIKKVKSGGK